MTFLELQYHTVQKLGSSFLKNYNNWETFPISILNDEIDYKQ